MHIDSWAGFFRQKDNRVPQEIDSAGKSESAIVTAYKASRNTNLINKGEEKMKKFLALLLAAAMVLSQRIQRHVPERRKHVDGITSAGEQQVELLLHVAKVDPYQIDFRAAGLACWLPQWF